MNHQDMMEEKIDERFEAAGGHFKATLECVKVLIYKTIQTIAE